MCAVSSKFCLFSLKQRVDEYDYPTLSKNPISNQKQKSFDQHWCKHTLSYTNSDTDKVKKKPINFSTYLFFFRRRHYHIDQLLIKP